MNRLAPPLQNSLAYSVPMPLEPGMRLPEPASRFVPRRELENLSIGLGRGQTAAMEGTRQLLTQPIATAQALIEAARQLGADPRIVLDMLRAARQKAMSGSLGLGELIGENVTPGFRNRRPTLQELDVYHGTPHQFPPTEANPLGEFDASKIGTGEGAQAYGHGIYFAENPTVAQGYQSTLRETNAWEIDGQRAHGVTSRSDAKPINHAAKALEIFDGDKRAAIAWLKDSESPYDLEAARLLAKSKTAQKAPGALYKADLPDEMIDRMLDWDKPLSEQPAAIRQALLKLEPDADLSDKGSDIYSLVRSRMSGTHNQAAAQASNAFRQAGIPGIRYLDAGSRGQGGAGTRNFVVFPGEEKRVRIFERK